MSEKLIVKNFGPIKHVELYIKKVNVLIGEQGTGKSALARLLNIFNSEGFLFGGDENQLTLIDLYGFFFKQNTFIRYETPNYSVIFDKEKFAINFSGNHKETLLRFYNVGIELFEKHNFNVSDEYYSLKDWFAKNIGGCNYIPAERIANINMNLRRGEKGNLDQYLIDFGNNFLQSIKIKELEIPYFKNVIYRRENNKDIVIFNGERLYLYQASSGFQSSIPMTVVLEYFSSIKDKIRFIIEEPELNLYPTTQYELVKYLVEKTHAEKNGLFLATHSPYILSSLNNLIFVNEMGKIDPVKATKIIPKKYWLDYKDVSAYMLVNGKANNIMDNKVKQIKAEKIDSISRKINEQYDEMLDIKYPKKNEG